MEKSKLMGCNPVRKIGNYGIENHETRPVEMSRRFSCTEGPKDRFHEALQFAVEGAILQFSFLESTGRWLALRHTL